MPADDFGEVHARLRTAMLDAAPGMVVTRDAPGHLELRTPGIDAATGEPGWFGTVTIKKSYVACHLIPLYVRPELADGISDALTKRRQGKTCFNFKRVDDALFAEFGTLMRRCADAV